MSRRSSSSGCASMRRSPDGKLAAIGVSRGTMLERIATRSPSRWTRASASRSSASTRPVPTWSSCALCTSAVDAGAAEVVVVDTLGIASPEAAFLVNGEVAERLDYDVPVHWHGHDDFGLAHCGRNCRGASGRDLGARHRERNGERARRRSRRGRARARGAVRHPDPAQARASTRSWHVSSRSAPVRRTRAAVGERRPVTSTSSRGSRARSSQFHGPPAIEPFASDVVGATRGIVLGKKSEARLDPDQARRARPRLSRRATRGAARRGQALGDEETRPRDRCRVPTAREPKAWRFEY